MYNAVPNEDGGRNQKANGLIARARVSHAINEQRCAASNKAKQIKREKSYAGLKDGAQACVVGPDEHYVTTCMCSCGLVR